MLGVSFTWSIRYCDMVLDKDAPRTRITTRSAYRAKIHSRLAGRVSHRPPRTQFRPCKDRASVCAAAIVDTGALQPIDTRHVPAAATALRFAIIKRVAGDLIAVRQLHDPIGSLGSNAASLLRRQNFHSKNAGLASPARRARSFATESGRKSQVVLDARTHSRLASRLASRSTITVCSPSDAPYTARRQTSRPSTYNREVVEVGLRTCPQSHFLSGRRLAGSPEVWFPSGKSTTGRLAASGPSASTRTLGLRVVSGAFNINPQIRKRGFRARKSRNSYDRGDQRVPQTPEFRRMPDDKKLASRRADHPTADRDVRTADPMASRKK